MRINAAPRRTFLTQRVTYDRPIAGGTVLELAVEAVAIDVHAFHDALHVVAGLAEGDHLDPVDHVDLAGARVVARFQPARHAVGAGIVGRGRQLVGAAEALQHLGEILAAELDVVGGIARQLAPG